MKKIIISVIIGITIVGGIAIGYLIKEDQNIYLDTIPKEDVWHAYEPDEKVT